MERQPDIETGIFMFKEGSFMIAITEPFCFVTFKWLWKTYLNSALYSYTIQFETGVLLE